MKKRLCAAALSLSLCASSALSAGALDVDKAKELLGEYYISELPAAAEQAQTLEELFAALNDPYTIYYSAEEYTEFLDSVNGEQLVGIGVALQSVFDNGFLAVSVFPDSPAQESGMKAGDSIIAVNGVTLTARHSIVELLTGEEGTSVTITVRRADGSITDFTMERRLVQIPIVTFEELGGIGWFDCSSFGDSTPDQMLKSLLSAQDDVNVWVMDLRNNPGGASNSAALTATHFAGGNTMVYYRDSQGMYYLTRTNADASDLTDKPLILLTAPSTASSAELFAGAIRDHYAGIAVGNRTYGKGIAQVVLDENNMPELFQGDSIKLTAYQVFSPKGLTHHLVGVLPTLMLDPADIPAVLELLSSAAPVQAQGWLKLTLAYQSFYLNPQACVDDPETFGALLEAIPPSGKLYRGYDVDRWVPITPAEAAQWRGASYEPRTFSDVSDSPYLDAINTLACYDLISGDGTGRFLPHKTITRGELCAALATAFQLPDGEVIPFSDVPADAWYAQAVSSLAALGFVVGTDEGTFLPDAPVTNQELCAVLSSIGSWLHMRGYGLGDRGLSAPEWLEFYHFSEWARIPARTLTELGVTVDTENPTVPVTREQFAGMLFELMDMLGMFWY